MSISNLTGTGKMNKLNNIYNVRYRLSNFTVYKTVFINFITSVKINNIDDLVNYIKVYGEDSGSSKNLNTTGYIFRTDMKMVYADNCYVTSDNRLQVSGYNEDRDHTTFNLPKIIPEGETGTIRITCQEV